MESSARSRSLGPWFLVLALAVGALGGCGRKDPGPGGLHVLLHLPQGPVAAVNSIDVSFDAPVAAVGQTGPAPNLVRIKPKVPGRARWIGTRTWSFVPEKPFPMGTTFECVVPPGTFNADRTKSVDKEVRWSFATPRPAVVERWPAAGTTDAAPDAHLLLQFNQPVDPNVVARAARLRPVGPTGASGDGVALTADRPDTSDRAVTDGWYDASPLQRVRLRPRQPLPRDTGWVLELAPTLRGMEGPLTLAEPWQTDFRTYGDFRLTSVTMDDSEGSSLQLGLTNAFMDDSLTAHLVFHPAAEVYWVSSWNPGNTRVGVELRPGTDYTVTLSPGFKDLRGNALVPPERPFAFRTPDARPSLALVPGEAVIERTRVREAALLMTNVDEVQLEMARLSADELARYQAEWMRRREKSGQENPAPALPAARVTRVLKRRTAWNVPDTLRIALDDALRGSGGVLVLHATALGTRPTLGDSAANNFPWPTFASTTLRVTDLGVTAKTSPTGGVVWVTSLATGQPQAGVELEMRGAAGGTLWRGTSDGQGLARVGALPADYLQGETTPRLWARRAGDETYLAVGRDWSLEAWNFGVSSEMWDPARDREGFLYADRELYRPGDTVHLKGIVRRRDMAGFHTPTETRVHVEVTDPRGNVLRQEDRELSRFGTLALDVTTPPAAPLGYYSVRLSPAGEGGGGWMTYGSFRVEEYKAPEFKVELTPNRRDYVSGEKLDATLSGQYFFGAPLAHADVNWVVRRNPLTFAPAGYADYTFGDPDIEAEYGTFGGDGRATLGADGRATLAPTLDLGPVPVSLQFEVEATVRDQTGRAVAATTQVAVHRGQVYPGLKLGSYFVDAGQSVPVTLVTLDPTGHPAQAAGGRVALVRREWRTARRLQVGGIIGSETTPFDSTLEVRPLPPGTGPRQLEFRIPGGGYYRIVAEATDGKRNTLRAVGEVYATGAGEFAWGWEPGIKVDLVADKASYEPGDRARLLVRSPFRQARALVTMEREGILSAETVELNGTSGTVSVEIPRQGGAPNVLVSVALVTGSDARAGGDPRLRLPEFRLGYVTLPVSTAGRRLAVTARPERPSAAPRDSMNVEIELRDATGRPVVGEVSLAVVDEAVLRLLGTKTPDPFSEFYRPKGTSVTTSELRRLVRLPLSSGGKKGDEPGGGGGADESFRSLFAATACWRPAVVTGADGRARVGFRLPDNLTTFRVMAVAVDDADRFGSSDTTFLVTKPLLVQPALPRFAHAGDEFTVGAVVHNRTDAPLTIHVADELAGLDAAGAAAPGDVTIPARDSRRVDFGVKAPRAGAGRVRFMATGPGVSDRVELNLPVVEAAARVFAATAGELAGETARETIAVPAGVVPDSSRLTVTLAPTLLGGLEPAFQYLRDYRYACLEQTASMQLGRLLEARLLHREPEAAAAARAIARITTYQNDDGGFHLWPGGGASQPWVTSYALVVLEEARRSGGDPGTSLADGARQLGWAVESATAERGSRTEPPAQTALALWALARLSPETRGGRNLTAPIDYLVARRAELTPLARLYLALAAAETPGSEARAVSLLDELDNAMEQRADMAWLPEAITDRQTFGWVSRPQMAGLYLAASLKVGRQSAFEPRVVRWLTGERPAGHWGDTQSDAMALLGLAAWQAAREAGAIDATVALDLGGRALEPARLVSHDAPPAVRVADAGAPGSTQPLTLQRTGQGTVYYTAGLSLLEPTIGTLPRENGLTLVRRREVLNAANPGAGGGTALRAGDLVLTRLTLVVPEEADYLVLVDPLPAGLEPVQLDFAISGGEASRRLAAAATPDRMGLPADDVELRDREVRAYVTHVAPGVYEYRYLARAVTAGHFAAPRAHVELMYHPEVSALSDGAPLDIGK